MKFVYMDESGKGFLKMPSPSRFIYGALIIERDNVSQALEIYKEIFSSAKKKVHQGLKEDAALKQLSQDERSKTIEKVLEKFEIHSVELFNPNIDKTTKQGDIIKHNPWKYISNFERVKIVEDLFTNLKPMINQIFMFQIEKESFNELFQKDPSVKEKEQIAFQAIIDYILDELTVFSKSDDCEIALIMDTLDSKTRESFVKKISDGNYPNLWAEPIVVESHKNAFVQLIDLITYVFYLNYTEKIEHPEHKRIRKAYKSQIKDLIITKDFVESLDDIQEEEIEHSEIETKEIV